MPSLRKRVSSYFRQLSFHNEPREKKNNINENSFVTKYLQGLITLREGPPVLYGKNPTDLPNYDLGAYETGPESIIGCYSGPNGGLTTVKRVEKHLSVHDPDIDFIDTQEDVAITESTIAKKSPTRINGLPVDNSTMIIKVAGQEYCVTNRKKYKSKSHSLGSLAEFEIQIDVTKIDWELYNANNNEVKVFKNDKVENLTRTPNVNDVNCNKIGSKSVNKRIDDVGLSGTRNTNETAVVKCNGTKRKSHDSKATEANDEKTKDPQQNFDLSKSKSDCNPFHHSKKGKIIKITQRKSAQAERATEVSETTQFPVDDSDLPEEWNRKSDFVYGLSDSLYDKNLVTKNKNGDPIADCFGVIARNDSAILALADGVNWGEKACIAAKSAVHGSLHYLNKTIFNDTKSFENLTVRNDATLDSSTEQEIRTEKTYCENQIGNTREVFICLLRAFNCAHDLILENEGMLTTLTVAVILPLKQKNAKTDTSREQSDEHRAEREQLANSGGVADGADRNRENVKSYICCVCNVGDTLAYVYSQKYGVRELTKGSHDVSCNRDMRDALGALGPVDGINPELNNLTLSLTTMQKGDIILIASDGLTDNFDPNVCKFTVNSKTPEPPKPKRPSTPNQQSHQKDSETKATHGTHSDQNLHSPHKQRTGPKTHHKQRDLSRSSSQRSQVSNEKKEEQNVKTKPPEKPPRGMYVSKNRTRSPKNSLERDRSRSTDTSHINSGLRPVDNKIEGISHLVKEHTEDKLPSKESEYDNPLIAHFMRENSLDSSTTSETAGNVENRPDPNSSQGTKQSAKVSSQTKHAQKPMNKTMPLDKHLHSNVKGNERKPHKAKTYDTKAYVIRKSASKTEANVNAQNNKYNFLRSKTSLDMRATTKAILRDEDGMPYVTPVQRYELTLLFMEDILRRGISGRDRQCSNAKSLCENLINFTFSITSAKRHTLEDGDLYYDSQGGVSTEISHREKKVRRKKALERVQNLPGKLDHVSCVAYNVGNFSF